MRYRTIGNTTVSAVSLGVMPLSVEHRPDEERATATIHAALDAGPPRAAADAPATAAGPSPLPPPTSSVPPRAP